MPRGGRPWPSKSTLNTLTLRPGATSSRNRLPGVIAMNELTSCYEREAGQVTFLGPPSGAAGEASIKPVPGLELAFDRVDGRLCRAAADTITDDEPLAFDPPVAAMLTRLFGSNAVDAMASPEVTQAVCPEPELTGTLSSLARLVA